MTLPLIVPVVLPAPICKVPAETVLPPEYEFVAESTRVPLPVLVSPKPPDTTPDKVNCEPVTLIVLLALMATVPDKLLVPVEVESVPPLRVIASAPTVTPFISRVAPLATVVPLATSPKPVALLIANVPAETVVAPV